MMIANDIHFKCDECGAIHSRGSLASGNTFGGMLFCDGKTIYPHLPEFPTITTCKRCSKNFWLDKQTKYVLTGDENEPIYAADFLSLKEYTNVFKDKEYRQETDELFLRFRMLWKFHDPYRFEESDVSSLREIPEYISNLERLIALSAADETPSEILMVAEFHRYLGQFDQAIALIEPLLESEVDFFAKILWKRNKESNACVFLLSKD
jgi:hypothetical protein